MLGWLKHASVDSRRALRTKSQHQNRYQGCVTVGSLAQQLCRSHQFLWFIAYLPLSLDEPAAIRAAIRYPDRSISLRFVSLVRVVLFLPRSFWRSWKATPPGEAVPKATWA